MKFIILACFLCLYGCAKPYPSIPPGSSTVFAPNEQEMKIKIANKVPGAKQAYDDMVKMGCFNPGWNCSEMIGVTTLP